LPKLEEVVSKKEILELQRPALSLKVRVVIKVRGYQMGEEWAKGSLL
jgi:hypothetical protein